MSTAPIDRWRGTAVVPRAARLLRGWVPLHAWSRRRRAVVAGAIASVACALATLACMATDFAGSAAAKAALASAHRELADAGRAQRALPALRRAASAAQRGVQRGRSSADDARNVSELAAASGIALVSLVPDAPGGQGGRGAEAFHVLKLTALGDFAQLRSFLHGLAHAPVLIVPTQATIGRSGSQVSLVATLSVFDALPSLPAVAPNEDPTARSNPFATNLADARRTVDGLRLAGVMQDRTRSVALVETSRGTDAVEPGDRIEGERVVRIAMPEVTLAAGGVTRALRWTEDGR